MRIVSANKSGMTLVEVLVSMVIICLALLPIFSALPSGAVSGARAKNLTMAMFLGEKRMEELERELRYDFNAGIVTGGDFGVSGFPKFRFAIRCNDEVVGKLKAINLIVWHDANGNGAVDRWEDKVVLNTKIANRN